MHTPRSRLAMIAALAAMIPGGISDSHSYNERVFNDPPEKKDLETIQLENMYSAEHRSRQVRRAEERAEDKRRRKAAKRKQG